MRILMMSKFLYLRGGLEGVMFDEAEWLAAAGHQVEFFGTAHPENQEMEFAEEFPEYRELGSGGSGMGMVTAAGAVRRMLWNPEAFEGATRVVERFEPDIVHAHGIHRHLSTSVLEAARTAGVPTVQTCHDFNHICANALLARGWEEMCIPPLCSSGRNVPAIRHRCVKGSRGASAIGALDLTYHQLRRAYDRRLDAIIAPSSFMGDLMKTAHPDVGVHVIPNARRSRDKSAPPVPGTGYVACVGRLSAEKGVDVLIEAARDSGVRVVVVGDGPERARLESLAQGLDVTFTGWLDRDAVDTMVAGSCAVAIPSRWVENCPLTLVEAMWAGRAVIGSRAGAIPEFVVDGETGMLVHVDDVRGLSSAMLRVTQDPALAESLGDRAHAHARERHSAEAHVTALETVYEELRAEGGRT